MRIPSTSTLALRLRARQVIATTALLWSVGARTHGTRMPQRPVRSTALRPASTALSLEGFAL